MEGAPALELRDVSKRFPVPGGGEFAAVDGVSLEVHPGEIVALLGPNGAGKTTAMQIALGLLDADAGEARLFGGHPETLATRRRLGYAPDAPLFPKSLTGLEVLALHGALLGLGAADARARAIRFAGEVGIAEAARRRIATYSRGQQQRLGVALSLLGDPDLVLLDEPTAGLDPAGVAAMRELLASLRARGAAVLLNSHLLSEVERVCDRVFFIKGGRVLRRHDMRVQGRRLEVRLANAWALLSRLPALFAGATHDGDRIRIEIDGDTAVPGIVRQLVEAGGEVLEVRLAGAELEELYLQIVEGQP
ncbi:MAG: ABC transporter ATP-binding protein [Myxococcales bacterium]